MAARGRSPIVPALPVPSRPPTPQETLQRGEEFRTAYPLSVALALPPARQAATSLAVQERRARAQEKRDLRQAKLTLLRELQGVKLPPGTKTSVRNATTFDDLLDVTSTIDTGLSLQSVTPAKLALAAARGDEEAKRALTLLSPDTQRTTLAELSKAAASGDAEAQKAIEILKDLRQSRRSGKKLTLAPEHETIATLRKLHFSLKTGGSDALEAAVTQLQELGFDADRARNIAGLLLDTQLSRGGRLYTMIAESIPEHAPGQTPAPVQPEQSAPEASPESQPALEPTAEGGVQGMGQSPKRPRILRFRRID
jgi:hypothetical protein